MTKRKKVSSPKYKRYNRVDRLRVGKDWVKLYEGKNVVKGYSRHFAVDKLCAIVELEMLGYTFSDKYKGQVKKDIQQKADLKDEQKRERLLQKELEHSEHMDEDFFLIAGTTEGGAPYGLTWDEFKEMEQIDVEEIRVNTKVKLSELIDEIENDFDEYQSFVNRETGEVIMVSKRSLSKAENEEPPEDMGSLDEELRIAFDIVDSFVKYVSLPDRFEIDEYQMMENFCFSIEDQKQKDILLNAINGKGAFRRFKDRAFDLGIIEDWYEYKHSCYRKIAIDFCEGNGLEYVE